MILKMGGRANVLHTFSFNNFTHPDTTSLQKKPTSKYSKLKTATESSHPHPTTTLHNTPTLIQNASHERYPIITTSDLKLSLRNVNVTNLRKPRRV